MIHHFQVIQMPEGRMAVDTLVDWWFRICRFADRFAQHCSLTLASNGLHSRTACTIKAGSPTGAVAAMRTVVALSVPASHQMKKLTLSSATVRVGRRCARSLSSICRPNFIG